MMTLGDFLRQRIEAGGFSTEDVLASFLPLVRETLEAHAAGTVAPFEGIDSLQVDNARIWFEQAQRRPLRRNESRLREIERANWAAVEVVQQTRLVTDVDEGKAEAFDLDIGTHGQTIDKQVYLPGYVAWEHSLDHHDPVTDIFSLGMILASLTCGLDLRDSDDLQRFVLARRNLFSLNADLHPVLAQAIFRMTQLDRHRRAQDLPALLAALENYRDQPVEFEFDLARIQGFHKKDLKTKEQHVLSKLRDRLFELTRRNRLLHFQPTMQTVNLTQASVPLSFDIRNVRPDQILIWNKPLRDAIVAGRPISLNKHLNFAEALYLPSLLDRIQADSRRDEAEFGFVQLRLVVCFLYWTNLKASPVEQYDSPLVLLPVRLSKKKGIRDSYVLDPLSSEAEINPVIRHQFKQLYDIDLPETIDLASTSIDQFFEYLQAKIQSSEPAVTLDKIDRPRIDLIYEKARRRLDQYRRRARIAGRGVRTFQDIQYSYDPANYHPLGVKLFSAKVRPPSTSLRTVVEETPRGRTFAVPPSPPPAPAASPPAAPKPAAADGPPVVEAERSLFSLRDGREQNPYLWSFDLCSLTLANFRYRKMSLVRDYESLLSDMPGNPAFEATFSLTPRPALRDLPATLPLEKRFDVVPCDPTQAMAIAEARAGKCYIIQGPPGTGKSQTIANLIADFAARGKRVLFVCEKRAAIDVVYARLRQRGLASLCCLIHDSQADKKAFVMDLKATYESLVEMPDRYSLFPDEPSDRGKEEAAPSGNGGRGAPAKGRRAEVLKRLKTDLRSLERFDQAMREAPPSVGMPLRQLLDRCIELRGQLPELDPLARERLPDHAQWWSHREQVARFAASLSDVYPEGVLARHPLRLLSPRLADQPRAMELIVRTAESARQHLQRLGQTLEQTRLSREMYETIGRLRQLLDYAAAVAPVARIARMALLDPQSEPAGEFARERDQLRELQRAWDAAREGAKGWRQKLPRDEVSSALQQARAFEQTWWAWLQPSWWRLRGVLNRCYDFQSHLVRPSWWQALQKLEDEYAAQAAYEQRNAAIARRWGLPGDVEQFANQLVAAQSVVDELPPWLGEVHSQWNGRTQEAAASPVAELAKVQPATTEVTELLRVQLPLLLDARPQADALLRELEKIADHLDNLRLDELAEELPAIENQLDCLPDFLACLSELAALPPAVAAALRELPLTVEQFEAAVAHEAVQRVYRADRTLARFTAASRDRLAARLEEQYAEWLDANAAEVRRLVGERFVDNLRLSETNARLTAKQADRKRRYDRGRRELTHEFGKSMRYKAIRDLVAGDSGEVVKDLKPVWLMSPLSVSDTLPLDADHFDVVIFDEASQITLEEAVPCLFRAGQAIVVGDEMQLPPTSFFSAKQAAEDEEDEEMAEEEAEAIEYDLTSDSFLNHAAKNLASTMLGWHYRSRSESLISFSNWAFYEGRLLTAPEEELAQSATPLESTAPEQADAHGEHLLQRAISFHHLPEAIYENRRNRLEADYIAHLVRGLLVRRTGLSIAVVAFSEAQQDEIEQALQRLAQQDAEFRDLLEAEWEREEDGQFIGLLVKNLENIQGDERDVVILSVCYGRGPTGRMLMNFGPINKSGGERRLNVAFTRAKRHMAIVSSIRADAITNDYNDGANCLKNYLRYAEAVSVGDMMAARRVLNSLSRWRDQPGDRPRQSPVAAELAAALAEHGFLVDSDVGQSHFRCALAVRREGDVRYRLGILLDDEAYYEQDDLLERDMMRPKLLRDFGWQVARVLAKDWHDNPEQILSSLLRRLNHDS